MTPPVKGAQVLKGGGGQRRLSQKPKFVVFFLEGFPKLAFMQTRLLVILVNIVI